MKTVIVDLDGTLCDCTHRLHYVTGEKKDYQAFNSACDKDEVYEDILELIRILDRDYILAFVSGREGTKENKDKTFEWLTSRLKTRLFYNDAYPLIIMRKEGDYRSDSIIKKEILEELRENGHEILFALDDRDSVVQMWRENGIRCLQVKKGDY